VKGVGTHLVVWLLEPGGRRFKSCLPDGPLEKPQELSRARGGARNRRAPRRAGRVTSSVAFVRSGRMPRLWFSRA